MGLERLSTGLLEEVCRVRPVDKTDAALVPVFGRLLLSFRIAH